MATSKSTVKKTISPIVEILLGSLTGSIATLGETKLVDVLDQLAKKNKTQYKAAIAGGRAFVQAIQPIVGKTGTKIDDALVTAVSDALETSAAANGVE